MTQQRPLWPSPKGRQRFSLFIKNPATMMRTARALANVLPAGISIGLSGELGAGKTTFVKGFAAACKVPRDAVTSPTFTIINEYKGTVPIFHADLYRIRSDEELVRTGIYDLDIQSGFLLIEWPEKFKSLANYLDLFLVFSIKKDGRLLSLTGNQELMNRIKTVNFEER